MKYSIIVPVYKVEKYLSECVNSLLNQTYTNYEIILVDDGSPDNCPNLCDEYSKKNKQIKVIHKKNGGLSEARNFGIKEATGDYLIFIDSDDYINSNTYLETINERIDNSSLDLLLYGNIKYYENNGKSIPKRFFNYDKKQSIMESLIESGYFKACAWDKVVRRNIIIENDIIFPKGKVAEDIEWCAKLLKYIDYEKVDVINENFYVYRQRDGSICRTLKGSDFDSIMDMIEQEQCNGDDRKTRIVNSYLANEYMVRLGRINCREVKDVSEKLKNRYYRKNNLLKYDLSKRVKMVNKIVKILGIKNTAIILGLVIDIKNKSL